MKILHYLQRNFTKLPKLVNFSFLKHFNKIFGWAHAESEKQLGVVPNDGCVAGQQNRLF